MQRTPGDTRQIGARYVAAMPVYCVLSEALVSRCRNTMQINVAVGVPSNIQRLLDVCGIATRHIKLHQFEMMTLCALVFLFEFGMTTVIVPGRLNRLLLS